MSLLTTHDRRRLLRWFSTHARPLPWRADRDPYRIWLSEVMLQQTTVATVTPRFTRFLTKFPSIVALANATEQEVLKEWEGLGYYRRARHLHQAAQRIVAEHGGIIPNDPEAFGALPGVGKYIVGAVLSQAFERRLPIVEANTRRVLSRLAAEQDDCRSAAVERRLWDHATALLPIRNIGDFNQAMMELGALVCTPTQPACAICPLQSACAAYRENLQNELPRKGPPPALEDVLEICIVPHHKGRVLLLRRGATGRWANMWEFPRVERQANETSNKALQRLRTLHGLNGQRPEPLTTIHYAVTRFRIEMTCFLLGCSETFALGEYLEGRWLRPDEVSTYPLSTAQRQLVAQLPPLISTRLEAH